MLVNSCHAVPAADLLVDRNALWFPLDSLLQPVPFESLLPYSV